MTISRRFFPYVLAALFGIVGISEAAVAARPRASVSLHSASVRLSDLFSGLEAGQDCDIGPAPAPGQSITIQQPQLAAIAEQFGVGWQPGFVTTQVVLERSARRVTREELLPLLRAALTAAGASQSSEVSLSNFTTIQVPVEIVDPPAIQNVAYDRSSGRFTAELLFDNPGSDPLRLRVAGLAQEMSDVPVLVRSMNAGSLISPEDLVVRHLLTSIVSERTLSAAKDAIGLVLRHRVMAGAPIPIDELSQPQLVIRGMPVLLRLQNTGLVLTARGEAMEGGALDELVHVLNPDTRAVLVAHVTGPGQVQVDPETSPVLLSSQQAGPNLPYNLAAMTRSFHE